MPRNANNYSNTDAYFFAIFIQAWSHADKKRQTERQMKKQKRNNSALGFFPGLSWLALYRAGLLKCINLRAAFTYNATGAMRTSRYNKLMRQG